MSRAVMRLQGVLLGVAMLLNLPAPPAARGGAPALACFRARSQRRQRYQKVFGKPGDERLVHPAH